MDNYIRKLQVQSLFGDKAELKVEFDEKINCLYGVNGSGKTTTINILVASMTCDVNRLSILPFSKVSIFISPTGKRRAKHFFDVIKMDGNIRYHFNTEYLSPNDVDLEIVDFLISSKRELDRVDEKKKGIVTQLIKNNVTTTYVPLSRMHDSDLYDSNGRPDEYFLSQILRSRHIPQDEAEDILDPSRRMLLKLEEAFKQKYSVTQEEINRNLDGLKDTILGKMLLNRDFASKYAAQNISFKTKLTNPDYAEYSKKLSATNLKISEGALKEHFEVMEDNITKLNNIRFEYSKLAGIEGEDQEAKRGKLRDEYTTEVSKYRALNPFYQRFFDVLEDVENVQVKKDEALKIFTSTEKVINDYLINKTFSFNSVGGFEIKCGKKPIKLADLSSGEKHMIALLGRVALSPEQGAVFVADEPELSLHLEWQRKILPAIQLLSPSIQIIVATHSPAIVPSGAKMIDLAECVK